MGRVLGGAGAKEGANHYRRTSLKQKLHLFLHVKAEEVEGKSTTLSVT